ncbi:MAG: SH3 domain-containing protein [Methylocystis sp.]|uniref:SH3 domain-containing protein n=1 Tax=Methylocystis sp. TaxID=1911079 RepID=UPI003DA49A5F
MFRPLPVTAAAICLGLVASLAGAQETSSVTRVTFKAGRAILSGVVKGYASNDYVFPAGAGESISVSLASKKAFFNVLAPGAADEAIFIGSTSGATFEGVAATSGDYTARVYLMRNEARRGTAARYKVTIRLGQKSAAQEKGGRDFADGLTGGPDYWVVTGVAPNDALALRAAPSPKGARLGQIPNGKTVKNLGCRNSGGQRWCQVEDGADRGWVNGRFLRE